MKNRPKTKKELMRDIKRLVLSRIRRSEKGYERLVHGDVSPTPRKKSKAPASIPKETANIGLEGGNIGTNFGENDRAEA